MVAELPSITSSFYASSNVNLQAAQAMELINQRRVQANNPFPQVFDFPSVATPTTTQEPKPMASQTRLVQVFIADSNDNIPLEGRLLYSGEQKLTDLTDQELFFEVDIKTLLDKHNEKRKATVNKAVKERTEYLEPARIRDLKMTVVTIAQF